MSWASILPPYLSLVETWIIRIFVSFHIASLLCLRGLRAYHICQLLLGLLTMGPWLLMIVYDLLLYIFRAFTYEIPYIGGRARGRQRPRAPSLAERPSGHRRTFSIGGPIANGLEHDNKELLRDRHDRSRNTSTVQASHTLDQG